MASTTQVIATIAILLVTLSAAAQAKTHIVGDRAGWTLNFNYVAWARGRDFRVGDRLVFRYRPSVHNVFKVGGSEFNACRVPRPREAMTSGRDVVTLTSPGRKWYICGKENGGHCRRGMKLFITVRPRN